MVILWILICTLYSILILLFLYGFNKLTPYKQPKTVAKITFSVIVPFKNEEANLPMLLRSLTGLQYPRMLYEIIFVNDNSTDGSVGMLEKFIADNSEFNLKLLHSQAGQGSPKKAAITLGVRHAVKQWIVTTDADCAVPEEWLSTLAGCITRRDPKMVVMPVTYTIQNTFLHKFQLMDFLSLMGSSMGGFGIGRPFMCNGANLAYERKVFDEVSGFKGNNHIGSGDDVFMLEKVLESYPGRVVFLKTPKATVTTLPQPSWGELMQQRKRWAAKTSAYKDPFARLVAVVVLLGNLVFPVFTIFCVTGDFSFKYILLGFAVKFNIDFFLIYRTALFFGQQKQLFNYYLGALIYPGYCVLTAIYSFFGSYTWKGNTFKK